MSGSDQLYEALCDFYARTSKMSPTRQLELKDFMPVLDALGIKTDSIFDAEHSVNYAVSQSGIRDFALILGVANPVDGVPTTPVRPSRSPLNACADLFDEYEQPVTVSTVGHRLNIFADDFKRSVYLSQREGEWNKTPKQVPLTRDVSVDIYNYLTSRAWVKDTENTSLDDF